MVAWCYYCENDTDTGIECLDSDSPACDCSQSCAVCGSHKEVMVA